MTIHDPLSRQVIGCAWKVQRTLGCGFLEKVYENAMAHECRKSGLDIRAQHPIRVLYDGQIVGEFAADPLVNGTLLAELKAVKALDDIHLAVPQRPESHGARDLYVAEFRETQPGHQTHRALNHDKAFSVCSVVQGFFNHGTHGHTVERPWLKAGRPDPERFPW